METSNQRIYRSNDRVVAGVVGGFAERLNIDPTLLRLAVVFLTVMTGILPGVITYLAAIYIMPLRPSSTRKETAPTVNKTTAV